MAIPLTAETISYGGLILALPALAALILHIWQSTLRTLETVRTVIDARSEAILADSREYQIKYATRLTTIEQAHGDMIRREQQNQQQWIRTYDETQRQIQTLIVRIDRFLERG